MMALVTIVVMYSKDDGRPFMHGQCFAAANNDEIREAFNEMIAPLINDGLTILDQMFVIAPDELVAKATETEKV